MAVKQLLYEVTYLRQQGVLPVGTKVQFISNSYTVESLYFSPGKLLVANFKEEIRDAYKRLFNVDVASDVYLSYGSNKYFELRCISLDEYKAKLESKSQKNSTTKVGTSVSKTKKKGFFHYLWVIIKWALFLLIAYLVYDFVAFTFK